MAHATNFKPAKGSYLIERKEKRKQIVSAEDANKRKVRQRDVVCRWARATGDCYCLTYKDISLHVAHIHDKGMGGDHGARSQVEYLILLCSLRHMGPISLHSGDCRITPLTNAGTSGPCMFEMQNEQKGWDVVTCEDAR